ncbi:MAG: hypothetical protein K9G41_06155, partial [Flavobacteriales bacterium]|nr:hypothetical protein [Flavobacteriales bacterium]
KTIIVSEDGHVQISENMMNIVLDRFYDDYCCAMKLLIAQLESGKLKNKKIIFENLGLLE